MIMTEKTGPQPAQFTTLKMIYHLTEDSQSQFVSFISSGLHDTLLFCSLRDPAAPHPAGHVTNKVTRMSINWNSAVSFAIRSGCKDGELLCALQFQCQAICLWLRVRFYLFIFLTDGVCMGQWRKNRDVSGQVYGDAGSSSARLLWEHGRWRDMAGEHDAEEGA